MTEYQEGILQSIRDLPFHNLLGLRDLKAADGHAEISLTAGDQTLNPGGMLHGAVVYALADITAYAAAVTTLEEGQEAVTHDLHVSMMRPGNKGDLIQSDARIIKRGRAIMFIDVSVYGSPTEPTSASERRKLIATVRVTKTILGA